MFAPTILIGCLNLILPSRQTSLAAMKELAAKKWMHILLVKSMPPQ